MVGGDHMDVNVSRLTQRAVDNRAVKYLGPPRPAAGAEHELRGVLRTCEGNQSIGDIGGNDLLVRTAELLEQTSVLVEQIDGRARQAARGEDVHAEQVAAGPQRHAGAPSDRRLGSGRPGNGYDNSFAGLPRGSYPVVLQILLERLVDTIGDP